MSCIKAQTAAELVSSALEAERAELQAIGNVVIDLARGRLIDCVEADRFFQMVDVDPMAAARYLNRHIEILVTPDCEPYADPESVS